MPDPNWKPEGAPEGSSFLQRLGVYVLGVGLGLLFLGWIQYRKHQAAQSQPPAPDSRQVEPAPGATPPPTAPDPTP